MNTINENEKIDIEKHTEYRDPKLWYGLLLLLFAILGIGFFSYIKFSKPDEVVVEDTQQKSRQEDGANFNYQIKEIIKPDNSLVNANTKTEEKDTSSNKPLVVYQGGQDSMKKSSSKAVAGVGNQQTQQTNALSQVEQLKNLIEGKGNKNSAFGTSGFGSLSKKRSKNPSVPVGTRGVAFDSTNGFTPVKPYHVSDTSMIVSSGAIIPAVLDFAIDSSLSGRLRSYTTRDVYSANGKRLLIPKGSKMIGQYSGGVTEGDTRVFFVWERIEFPNGMLIDIDSTGIDAIGRSGIGGSVDERFFYKFGSAILLSLLQISTDGRELSFNDVNVDTGSLEQIVSEIVSRRSQIPPIIRVPQGQRFNIFVSKDIDFSDYLQ